jgi:3',5'-cyclic AMP phosphodiesterase CpdA
MQRLAHLSDLHLGQSPKREAAARRLVRALLDAHVDHVVITGDLTHRGLRSELALFRQVFAPLLADGRVSLVPGNHDRLGEDIGEGLMGGRRVSTLEVGDFYLVSLDSTGPHNQNYVTSYGELSLETLHEVERAVRAAPQGKACILLLHHHPLSLPEDTWLEWGISLLGFRHSEELTMGKALLRALQGRCDAVLHGHRHQAWTRVLFEGSARPLVLANAGSSTESGTARLFVTRDARLAPTQEWLASLLPLPKRHSVPPLELWPAQAQALADE